MTRDQYKQSLLDDGVPEKDAEMLTRDWEFLEQRKIGKNPAHALPYGEKK